MDFPRSSVYCGETESCYYQDHRTWRVVEDVPVEGRAQQDVVDGAWNSPYDVDCVRSSLLYGNSDENDGTFARGIYKGSACASGGIVLVNSE
jgi:hypothetical protein